MSGGYTGIRAIPSAMAAFCGELDCPVNKRPFSWIFLRDQSDRLLGYAVSPTGADRMHNFWDNGMANDPVGEGLKGFGVYKAVPMTELNAEKIRAYKYASNWAWLGNSLGMCAFIPWTGQQLIDLVSGATGWTTNQWELMRAGERGVTLARVFNMREGKTRADDTLPHRLMNQGHLKGKVNEKPISKEELSGALTIFYGMMG